jgi:hypothetical protein
MVAAAYPFHLLCGQYLWLTVVSCVIVCLCCVQLWLTKQMTVVTEKDPVELVTLLSLWTG